MPKDKTFFKKLHKIWNIVNSSIATIASIVTIIALFFDLNPIIRYIAQGIIIIYVLGMLTYIIRSILKLNNAKAALEKDYLSRNQRIAEKLHTFYHTLRDDVSSMDMKKISSYNDVIDKCKNVCNCISDFYNVLFSEYLDDYTVSVCIKSVKPDTKFDEDYNNWLMETIARSTTTSQDRSSIDKQPVKISENTDFQVILSEKYRDELLSFSDMTNITNDFLVTYEMPYRNSTRGSDFLNYYQSTIIVPIKISGRYIANDLKEKIHNPDNKDLILGFLCIDSMKAFKTMEEIHIFTLGVEYAKQFGDALYILCEKILLSCLENVTINAKNVTNTQESTSKKKYSPSSKPKKKQNGGKRK